MTEVATAPSLEADWDTFCVIEDEIGSAESTGIEARWRCGRMLLRYEKRPGSKNSPLADALRRLSSELGVSESELKNRRQFAEERPTKTDLANALASFSSWHEIVASGLGDRQGSMDVHYSSETDLWATPQDLFNELNAEFGFELDVCATPDNAKCARYFTEDDDGLAQEWRGICWMNPPYGREIADWMDKAYQSSLDGATVVCLVPARTDTDWWWEAARHGEVRFLRGRLKFGDAENSAPFPSAVVILGRPANVVWWER